MHRCIDISVSNRLGLINICTGQMRLLWHSYPFDNHCRWYIFFPIKSHTPFPAAIYIITNTDERNNLLRKKAQQIPHGMPSLREVLLPHPEEDML